MEEADVNLLVWLTPKIRNVCEVCLGRWQATEKPESYVEEQRKLDGSKRWRTTEKSVIKGVEWHRGAVVSL